MWSQQLCLAQTMLIYNVSFNAQQRLGCSETDEDVGCWPRWQCRVRLLEDMHCSWFTHSVWPRSRLIKQAFYLFSALLVYNAFYLFEVCVWCLGSVRHRYLLKVLVLPFFSLTEDRSPERWSGLFKVTRRHWVTESPSISDMWPFTGPSFPISECLQRVTKLGRQVFSLGQRVHNEHLMRCWDWFSSMKREKHKRWSQPWWDMQQPLLGHGWF